MSDLVEQVARAMWTDMLKSGQANDLREWEARAWQEGEWECSSPAVDDKTKRRILSAARAALSVLEPRIEALERELAEAREALVAEREETLWSAYSSGLEKDGRWTHMFMSDGEWLVREIGLDPRTGHYDAEYIKAAIPRAARAAIRNGERG